MFLTPTTRAQLIELNRPRRDRLLKKHVDALTNAGIDARAVLEAWREDAMRFDVAQRSIRENASRQPANLREAITTSQLYNTINLTTVNEIIDDYVAFQPVYKGLAEERRTKPGEVLYRERWSDDMPEPVAETEPASETRVTGGTLRIKSREFARELVISKRAFDNDDLGDAKAEAREFGQKFEQVKDKYWVFAAFRAANTSNWGTGTGRVPPQNLAGQTTGMTTSPGAITPQRIEDALTAPSFFEDPFHNAYSIEPDTVLIDSFDRLKTMRFIDSLYTPVGLPVPTDPNNTAAGPMTNNPLKGMLTVKWSRWVRTSRVPLAGAGNGLPWAVFQAGKGVVMQTVHDLEVEMEAPNAGASHDTRTYRWQGVVEFGAGHRNPRTWFWGN